MSDSTTPNDIAGALTLLRECVGGQAGQRLLIVCEAHGIGYYDEQAPRLVAAAARSIGMVVYETQASSSIKNDTEKVAVLDSLNGFDHVVFFSRVGDQLRFSNGAKLPSSTMCYALCGDSLNSKFGTACHYGMSEIKTAIDSAFNLAREIQVTCPRGTDYIGTAQHAVADAVEVSLKRFPMLVPKPIPATGFRGRVVLSRFLLGTGSQYYEPYCLDLPNDVVANVDANQIVHFDGNDDDVSRVQKHYKRVSDQFAIDPWYVDSWHVGIHPACEYADNAEDNKIRWSNSAFGNPRVLHFHTCGQYAPGEISWHVIDPTIYLDGVPVWEAGQLFADRLPECANILNSHPKLATLFANPTRQIGISA